MTADVSHIFENARVAARKLNLVDTETIDKILLAVAYEAEKEVDYILQENCRDLALMPKTDPKYDRLMLSRERILGITSDMRKVAGLPSPLGRILASFDRPNGMRIEKVSVPFGVIGIIYEARPNVTFDVFSLCLKSGNVCILKGGSDAQYSNNAIINIINKVLISYGIDSNTVTLLPNGQLYRQVINRRGTSRPYHSKRQRSIDKLCTRTCACTGYRNWRRDMPHLFRQ